MPSGVLDEIEVQSKRIIAQKKQEVAQLAQYHADLQSAIDEHNKTLVGLQTQKSALEQSIQQLKDDEAGQLVKIKQAEGEATGRLNETQAKLTTQAENQSRQAETAADREKEVGRKERNLAAEKARVAQGLTELIASNTALLTAWIAKL